MGCLRQQSWNLAESRRKLLAMNETAIPPHFSGRWVTVVLLLMLFSLCSNAEDPANAPTRNKTYATASQLASCSRIEDVDFHNATFESGGTVFSFRHGKAHHRDCPESGDESLPWDWEAEIQKDVLVSPSPKVNVRFLLIHDEHKTGTGWWYHLVGFRCAPGEDASSRRQLIKVFERTAMSLRIEKLTNENVTFSITSEGGRRRRYQYRWDVRSGSFALQR